MLIQLYTGLRKFKELTELLPHHTETTETLVKAVCSIKLILNFTSINLMIYIISQKNLV